ncbi:NAD-dependent epimerase/dehydratase family protein [Pseudidiomarina taiwanensis]|uniref:NAD(P)-dependent oxidoreductase n=1 Tax=Pseudidiomarina taiwanensis TaxID=337250 RepID=A0A432ZK27_9GAMM|nr:NAD-dependent epimerase/dehydratase family protein [Pseudidiomarina taiwanensis]RUO78321.1 NAD(P)-dependent oxidoreductase [Pseudidiomarina taiwanensis]
MQKRVLFIGYGDIAQRTAARLSAAGFSCWGLCRQPDNKPLVAGVELIAGDACNEVDLRQALALEPDYIVITLTPARQPEDDPGERYHQGYVVPCRHLQHLLSHATDQHKPQVFYVSSTSVYGVDDGRWLDESSPAVPNSATGQALLQAEQVIASIPQSCTILRCSGIYGPGREMARRLLEQGRVTLTPAWTNRIHADDVAGFITHLVQHPPAYPLYIVSDNQPVQQADFYRYLAQLNGLAVEGLAETQVIGPRGSKRLDNSRLRSSGYQLRYATYQSGGYSANSSAEAD